MTLSYELPCRRDVQDNADDDRDHKPEGDGGSQHRRIGNGRRGQAQIILRQAIFVRLKWTEHEALRRAHVEQIMEYICS